MLYSKSSHAFYDREVNSNIPGDAVEISDELYKSVFSGHAAGMQIGTDSNGLPCLENAPEPSMPFVAQTALTKSDLTVLRCLEKGVAVPAEVVAYRAALRQIVNGTDTTSKVLPAEPARPAI